MQDKRVLILLFTALIFALRCSSPRDALYRDLKTRIAELSRRVEAVNLKVKDLEDSLYILDDRIKSLEKSQQQMRNDLLSFSRKIASIESAQSSTYPAKKREKFQAGETAIEGPTPENLYRRAYDLLMSRKYESAQKLFEKFLQLYPQHSLADNSAYWIGECYYAQKKYDDAINYFMMVIEDYPGGNKVPDAMLKLAFTYERLGLRDKAVHYLKKLIADFPFSEPSGKAKIRLKELEKEGEK